MKRLSFALPLLGSTLLAMAQAPAPTPNPASSANPANPAEPAKSGEAAPKAPRYQLKGRSAFNVPAGMRAPFLPIGWVKPAVGMPVVQQVTMDSTGFRLTSLLLGNPSLAVINGRSYEEGQFLRMPRGGPQIRVQLYRIGDGQVWLKMDDKLVNVPLKRPELGERKVDESLLSEERDVVPDPNAPQPKVQTPSPSAAATPKVH